MEKASRNIVKAPNREAIVCEGQIDVIRCHACGFDTAIASEGTAFTKEQAALLKRSADNVVLLYDADNAGRKAAVRSAALLMAEEIPVRVASMPDGEDPDSFLRERQPQEFRKLLDEAISITIFQIRTLKAAERDPNSVGAVARIGREVVSLIAKCPSGIIRAKLINDAAAELNVPQAALEEDLAREFEDTKQRARRAEKFKTPAPAPAVHQGALEESPAATLQMPNEKAEEEENLRNLDLKAVEDKESPPPKDELAACAFLLEFEHDAELLDFVNAHIPASLFTHRLTHGLAKAIFLDTSACSGPVQEYLASLPPEDKAVIGGLLIQEHKTAFAREFSKEEAAQSFIRKLWIKELTRIRETLDATDDTPENASRLFALTIQGKKIANDPWEMASRQILELKGLSEK